MPDLSQLDNRVSSSGAQNVSQRKTSLSPPPSFGKASAFSTFPAVSGPANDTFSAYLKQHRDGDPSRHRDRDKQRERSQSRSASSVSNLLLVATERLGQETHRANELEVRCSDVLSRLRTIVDERESMRRALAKTQEELSLYKLQLDVAQNEIFRAQKIVDDVDKARQDAEEQAAKDRSLARQLASEKAVWIAREEGRTEGFKEGLKQGRRWAADAARRQAYEYSYTDAEYRDEDAQVDEGEPDDYEPSTHHSSPTEQWSSPSRSAHSVLPDRASYAPTLPLHAISRTPRARSADSVRQLRPQARGPSPPSVQPDRAPSRRSSSRGPPPAPTRPDSRASRPLPRAPVLSPDTIDIRSQRRNSHSPLPVTAPAQDPDRPSSPTRTQRSTATTILPDGFIPTMGADLVISLPAPHSLSRPVSIVGDDNETTRGGVDMMSMRGRTMSNVSRVSTRMSQYDLLRPPQPSQTPVPTSEQIVREWRAANSDTSLQDQRPAPTQEASSTNENFSVRSSTRSSQNQPPRQNLPRRPREIVMPMPLSATIHATGMSNVSTRPRASTSAAIQQEQYPIYTAPTRPSTAAPAPTTTTYPAAPAPASAAYVSNPAPQLSSTTQDSGYFDFDPSATAGPGRPRSAIAWIKRRFSRSFSAQSVPTIQIEPPSNPASNPSTERTVDAVLLAADDAGTTTLPVQFVPELAGAAALTSINVQPAPGHGGTSTAPGGPVIVLPDNDLPPGFVPLSPIVGLPDGLRSTMSPSPQPPAYSVHPHPQHPGDFYASSSTRSEMGSVGSALLQQQQQQKTPVRRPLRVVS